MSLRVSEQVVESKSDDRFYEDLIVVTEHFAAVIDGASDETGTKIDRKTVGGLPRKSLRRRSLDWHWPLMLGCSLTPSLARLELP